MNGAMRHAWADPTTPRLLIALALLAVLLSFGARVYYVADGALNEDEGDVLNKAWLIDQGQTKYLDFLGIRPPFAFQYVRPVLWLFDRPSRIVVAARLWQLPLDVLTFLFLFLLTGRLANRTAAWWAVLLVAGFGFFASRTAQVRAEPLTLMFLFAGLWQYVKWRDGRDPTWRIALAGLLLGASLMSKPTAIVTLAVIPVFFLVDWRREPSAWRSLLGDLLRFSGGAALVVVLGLVWTCGRQVFSAVYWLVYTLSGLRVAEGSRAFPWFVLQTFWANPFFWLAVLIGWAYAHAQWLKTWRQQRREAAGWLLVVLLGWSNVLSVVLRRALFQQDLIFPGLMLAVAGGTWLGRAKVARRRARIALWFVLLIVPLFGDLAYERYLQTSSVASYRRVLGGFWNEVEPPNDTTPVDAARLLDFLQGSHDVIRFYPHRTLAQDLALADRVAVYAPPGAFVLTEFGLGIEREETVTIEKPSVLRTFVKYEGPVASPLCRSLRRFVPRICEPGVSPGQRTLDLLTARPPRVIVFHFGVADLLAREPETRAWFITHYHAWYDARVQAFFAAPLAPHD
jgi:hypothetical protein